MGPPETDPSGFSLRYLTPSVHSTNFVDMPRNPAMISQNVAPWTAYGHRDGDATDVADADRARDSRCKRLEVRNFACVLRIGVVASHELDRVLEAANIDEAHVEGEEGRTNDQPEHHQRQLRVADRNFEEHDFAEPFSDRRGC